MYIPLENILIGSCCLYYLLIYRTIVVSIKATSHFLCQLTSFSQSPLSHFDNYRAIPGMKSLAISYIYFHLYVKSRNFTKPPLTINPSPHYTIINGFIFFQYSLFNAYISYITNSFVFVSKI